MMRLLAVLGWAGLLAAQRAPVEDAWDLLATGQRNQAVRVLRSLLASNPRDADARLLLGSILAEQGEGPEAIGHLSEAVRMRPQSAEAQNALGEAYLRFRDAKSARPSLEKAVALDPDLAQARVNLSQTLLEAGEFQAAAQHLDRALELLGDQPDAAFPHYLRAKVHTEHNELDKALAELRRAVSLRPDFAEAWSDLGQARKNRLDDSGALSAFQRAVELDPDNAVAQYRLGAEYFHQGKARESVTHLERSLRLDPANQSALYNLQLALRETGDTEKAGQVKQKLADLLRARDKASQDALTAVQINNQGAELEKAGNLRAALEKYRAALALDPEHAGIRVNFAVALLRLGRWAEGIAELREAMRRDPGNPTLKAALDDALAQAPPGTPGKK